MLEVENDFLFDIPGSELTKINLLDIEAAEEDVLHCCLKFSW